MPASERQKHGTKRGRARNSNQGAEAEAQPSRKKAKKAKKTQHPKLDLQPQTLQTLRLLAELGRPFEDKVKTIVDYASAVLDGRQKVGGAAGAGGGEEEEIDAVVAELLLLEEEWKGANAGTLARMRALLERNGLIPFGGVEAVGGGGI